MAATTWGTPRRSLQGGEDQRGDLLPNGADGEDWGGECWTPGLRVGATETRPRLKDGARRIREPWGSRAGSTCPRLSPPPLRIVLTVPEPNSFQRPEELTADVLTVPTGFSQTLGHCEVKGVQIIARLSISNRVMIS